MAYGRCGEADSEVTTRHNVPAVLLVEDIVVDHAGDPRLLVERLYCDVDTANEVIARRRLEGRQQIPGGRTGRDR